LWICVVVLALLCASQAVAQTDSLVGIRKGSIELGAAGGLSVPVGDYGDYTDLSGTGGIVVGYYISPRLSVGLDAAGHWHGPSDFADSLKAVEVGQSDADLTFKLYRFLTPYVKYQLKVAKVSPYLSGLAGLYLQEVHWTQMTTLGGTVSQTVSQGYFGVAVGAGVQWVSDDNVELFVEGRMHNAMRGDSFPLQFFDLRVGVAFLL
jgi:hypothetical protein